MKKFIHIFHLSFFIPLFLLAGFLTACENDIEFTGEESKPLLVINSIIHAGQPIDVRVSRSIFFLDTTTTEYILSDAVVNVSINGVSATLPYDADTQSYRDERIAHEGDHIVVTASHLTYGQATGETTVPHTPKNVVTTTVSPYGGWKNTSYTPDFVAHARTDSVLHVSIRCDLPDDCHTYRLVMTPPMTHFTVHNLDDMGYYGLEVYVPYGEEDYDDDADELQTQSELRYTVPTTTRTLISMEEDYVDELIDNLDIPDDETPMVGGQDYLFTDELLKNSASKTLDFNVMLSTPIWWGGAEYYYDPNKHLFLDYGDHRDCGNPWDFLYNDFVCRFVIQFSAVSEEYYKYWKSVRSYEGTEIDFFSEPVQIYSNIQGGIGIVAALATQTTECNHRYSFPLNK